MTDDDKALVERLRADWPEILVEKHWMMDSDAIEEQRKEAADRIEAQAAEIERLKKSAECLAETRRLAVKDVAELEAEIERLREALRPFAIAGEKGRAVYIGVAMAMKEKPELFPYSTAYVDAGRTTAASHLTWNDYDEARLALTYPEAGQPWLRTYDEHLKGTNNAE